MNMKRINLAKLEIREQAMNQNISVALKKQETGPWSEGNDKGLCRMASLS